MMHIGRNDPCPCGSGKKFKKCCLSNQEPASSDRDWLMVHEMHKKLVNKLMKFTAETYGTIGYNAAWDKFHHWSNETDFDPSSEIHPMFGPWLFYHWTPIDSDFEFGDVSDEDTPAEAFLDKNEESLSDLEIEDLEESLRRPYSFLDVLEVKPGEWIKVYDLFTDERFTVIEKTGSRSIKRGDLLFGKVVTIRDISLLDGLAPFAFPPQFKIHVIDARKTFEAELGPVTIGNLRQHDMELLEVFWDLREAIFNPPPPILTNTDGHLMMPHKLTFKIDDLNETLDALHSLCFELTKREILDDAEMTKSGAIKSIEFPWLMKGNKQNKSWDNTVLGHIRLTPKKMIVDVNSKERSEKFMSILKKRMPTGWKLEKTKVEDVKALWANAKSKSESRPEGGEYQAGGIHEIPEVQAQIARLNAGHWEKWPSMPLPALHGKTPVEAIKTGDGRAAVDALLTQFERDAERKPLPGQDVNTFKRLRERLGL